ncbi:anthranilate synthase component I family protein [Wenyingzhuangia sp. IMCC45574]
MKKLQFKTVVREQMADTVTPVSIYLRLRDRFANTVLLEGSDYHSKEDSYTFIGVDPLVHIKAEDHALNLYYRDAMLSSAPLQRNYHDIFQYYCELIQTDSPEDFKSFNGLYGYTTYDAVQYFENIKLNAKKADSAIPLLHYSFYRYVIVINHFNDEMKVIENLPVGEESNIDEVVAIVNNPTCQTQRFSYDADSETSSCTDEEFKEYVRKGKAHCKRGDVFQIVLSRQFQQKYKGDDFTLYRALRSINPSPYLFYFDYGNFRLMGSSPEAQIKVEDKVATINPIAGTFRRTGNAREDHLLGEKLSNDKKETAEHVMLVDLARNDLSKHADNVTVEVFKEVQYFSHVIHLVSTVEGIIKGNPLKIVGDTFPAGTLSGAPKYKAMQLIDQYESQTRGFYGGAVGVIGLTGEVNLAIGIRSFVSKNNTLYYQAGAGIVMDSTEEGELQEVNNKLAALKKALVLAEEI